MEKFTSSLPPAELADLTQRLLGVVTALRHGHVGEADQLVSELERQAPSAHDLLLLTAGLAAALAEMGELEAENLLEVLALIVIGESNQRTTSIADEAAGTKRRP
jgi:hypothetical protein